MTTPRDLAKEVAELKETYPDSAERWVRALAATLPPQDTSVAVVEDMTDGQPIFKDPATVVRETNGIMQRGDGANVRNPPEEWSHVGYGPKGVSSDVVLEWDLYVDLEEHRPPPEVDESSFPVEVLLTTGNAFA